MTDDPLYDPLDHRNAGIEASRSRRTASIASTYSPESEQLLTDVARAKSEGMKLSPRMTLAAAYAQSGKDAAAKTGQGQ